MNESGKDVVISSFLCSHFSCTFKTLLIIHKDKNKNKLMFNECLLCLINTRLNFTSNFLDENNPKSNSERMS